MDSLRQYIFAIICGAIICGLVQKFFDRHSSMFHVIRLITGLVMTVIIMRPILNVEVPAMDGYFDQLAASSQWAVAIGSEQAMDSMTSIIKSRIETYIMNKAVAMGAEISAEVEVSQEDPPVPVSVSISGSTSPYVRNQLSQLIETDLGIAKELQVWK